MKERNHSPPKARHISGLAELAKITAVDAKIILLLILSNAQLLKKNKYERKEHIKMLSKSVVLSVATIATVLLLVIAAIVANHQASAYYYHGKHYRYYHNGEYYNQRFPVDATGYYCYGTYAYCHY